MFTPSFLNSVLERYRQFQAKNVHLQRSPCNFLAFRSALKRLRVRETMYLHFVERFRRAASNAKLGFPQYCAQAKISNLFITSADYKILWKRKKEREREYKNIFSILKYCWNVRHCDTHNQLQLFLFNFKIKICVCNIVLKICEIFERFFSFYHKSGK